MRWKGLWVPRLQQSGRSTCSQQPDPTNRSQQPDRSVREAIRSVGPRMQSDRSASRLTEHANVDSASLGKHRSTQCLPPRKAPFPGATRQVVDHSRTPTTARPLARTSGSDARRPWGFPLNPVTVSGGVRDFYRRHPDRARGWRRRFQDSSLVHRGGHVYPQAEASYPPVIHWFIHTFGRVERANDCQRHRDCEDPAVLCCRVVTVRVARRARWRARRWAAGCRLLADINRQGR